MRRAVDVPRPQDVARPEKLGADRVAEHDLARQHPLADQQAEVHRVRAREPAAVPLADGKVRHPDTHLALRRLAAFWREELAELRIELEQRLPGAPSARRTDACRHLTVILMPCPAAHPVGGLTRTHAWRVHPAIASMRPMPRSPDLVECAASLLEADPGLVRVLGLRDASTNGHRRVLPVLSVDAGEWSPPERDALGAGTVALAVLDGWLTDGEVLIGPRDPFDAWSARWTICTHARMAVIGDAFAGALRTWPRAGARSPDAPRTRVPANDRAIEDRVLELLWRIALRWGQAAAGGVVLPTAIDARAVCLMLGEPQAGLALARLEVRGVTLRRGALHLLPFSGSDTPRRDMLRAAASEQLALARAANDDCLALCELLDVGLRGRARRIPAQTSSTR